MNKKEVPDSWRSRCSGDGYEKYIDKDGVRRYRDNNIPVEDDLWRPCAKCGQFPTDDGDDYCIKNLGKVMNACCGHGKNKGYIQFDNGVTIRGYFDIEKNEKCYNIKYCIRSREEILNRISKLQVLGLNNETLLALKWVMKMD